MSDEALRLLERIRAPGASAADKMKVYKDIDAFLAQPEPAAREAVLVEAVRTLLDDIEKDGCIHWSKYGGAGQRQQGIRVLLADTSPAAAALLAQVAAHEGHELRREEPVSMGLQQLGIYRLVCVTCEGRAALTPREKE